MNEFIDFILTMPKDEFVESIIIYGIILILTICIISESIKLLFQLIKRK